ncbi:MAG: sigma-54-dependent transcriptional regulator [Chitinispirillaceae bacterium]
MSKNLKSILLVDDEEHFLKSASFVLRSSGFGNISTCQDSRCVMERLQTEEHELILLDVMMPNMSGNELIIKIKEKHPHLPVVIVTAVNDIDSAVDFMKSGAFDYIVKPVDKARLVTTVQKALEHGSLLSENSRLRESFFSQELKSPTSFEHIVTKSRSMQSIFRYIEAIAPTPLPVLVTGETGSGKELIARALHNASGRKGEFVAVNVAGLDDNLFCDALFGHEKGAYTGAERHRSGLIAKAEGGTLFLDEIGELRMESQVKLLRLLEDRTYYQVGSDKLLTSDARIVVATNAEVDPFSGNSGFRKDLFFRLQSHHIKLPPLRNRKEDIEPLLNHFIQSASRDLDKKPPALPPQLHNLLATHSFPGNVRELRGMVFDAVSRHSGKVLSMECFKEHIARTRSQITITPACTPDHIPTGKVIFTDQLPSLKEIEKALVEEALRRAKNNQSIAANILGITRSALNKRLNNPRNS